MKLAARRDPPMSNALERQLEAARGWLIIGLPDEAAQELDRLPAKHWLDPGVLTIRAGALHQQQSWSQLEAVARLLYDACPKNPQWPISLALATRHLRGRSGPSAS